MLTKSLQEKETAHDQDDRTLVVKENADQKASDPYNFEMSEEVKNKISYAQNLHEFISEDAIADLVPITNVKRGFRFFKRTADIIISFIALIILLAPMLIIAMAVFIDDPGKVLFSQYRVGKNGRRFKLYKFRTMKKSTPKYLSTAEIGDPKKYITRLGRFLRKYSLDELPQLINVFKGDMSIVGPRPLISDEYEIHQMRMKLGVYKIRPGITGLAQINGRDTVSPENKVRWDHKYLESFGFKTDVKIFLATIPRVFGHAGVVEGYTIKEIDKTSDIAEKESENAFT